MSRSSSGIGRLGPGSEVFIGNDPYGFNPVSEVDIQEEEKNYNIRIGSFDMSIAAGLDRVQRQHHAGRPPSNSDVIFRPQLIWTGPFD